MKIIRLFLLTALTAILCVSHIRPGFAQPTSGSLESDVKAAYILNIMKFVDWENRKIASDDPLKIGIAGSDPVGNVLEKLANNKIGGHTLVVERLGAEKAASAGCHLIFICHSENSRLDEILKQLKGASVLTVSDVPDFARRGGIVGFVIENDRVKIEININEAKRAGLKIGAKLLEVARLIK